MNCLEFRRQCRIDPACQAHDYLAHKKGCRACAADAVRQAGLELQLRQAVQVPVPAGLAANILLRQSMRNVTSLRPWRPVTLALAASVLLALIVTLGVLRQGSEMPMDHEIIAYVNTHVHPVASATAQTVSMPELNGMLQEFGMHAAVVPGEITMAERCIIRKRPGMHLVLQGKMGPVDVLVMPDEKVDKKMMLNSEGKHGMVVPCPRGSMAIVGRIGEPLGLYEQRLMGSFSWI